jgi:hypothetical protein
MKSAACSNSATAYAWIHYGTCGKNSSDYNSIAAMTFDADAQFARCATTPLQPFLDHSWRGCFSSSLAANHTIEACLGQHGTSSLGLAVLPSSPTGPWCSPLACYPRMQHGCAQTCGVDWLGAQSCECSGTGS